MSQTYYAEHLRYIAAITEALNKLPEGKDYYAHVELREEGTHRKVGEWSDEIGPDCWYYNETEDKA